ncbi:hypothetical protein J2B92_11485 [Lysinibacillus sphaericus]|uniref:hypothetical protein n=1 Tax=Lysinibacillus sphaericus TaxID=1421 RepID=UPI0018CE29A6|nr:hypothetical protein [Lysinibacillus sphaericus]MBG9754195.1 hypothetical protein [Lysinibacillus sphaericus]QTB15742.1 hypothetical protein J2B92_11485 [Lysinibacillus sphaericus]
MLKQKYLDTKKERIICVERLRHDKDYSNVCIYLPGYGCYKDEMSYLFSTISKKHTLFNHILFDYTGCGDSEGTFDQVNLNTMTEDAEHILHYVSERYKPKNIYIVARGLGIIVATRLKDITSINKMVFIGKLEYEVPNFSSKIMQEFESKGSIELRILLGKSSLEEQEKVMKWISSLGWVYPAERISYSIIKQLREIDMKSIFNKNYNETLWFTHNTSHHSQYGKCLELIPKDVRGKNYSPTEVDYIVINSIDWLSK